MPITTYLYLRALASLAGYPDYQHSPVVSGHPERARPAQIVPQSNPQSKTVH